MKHVFILAILLLVNFKNFSQNIVIGKVIDEDRNPVSYAVIVFEQDSGKNKTEKIANENGLFKMQLPANGSYQVKASHVAFSDYNDVIGVPLSDTLQIILVKAESQMQDVVVTARKPLISRKIDRVVMNVSDNPITAGRSSLELFQLVPGVFVNNGEISINGVSGARVMINGKMLNLNGDDLKDYLQNLSSNDIESVEVIAHPPAEYDAQGAGGLINIVLKKNAQRGLNGYVGAEYSQGLGKYPGYSPYLNLNYNVKKWSFNANYSYEKWKTFTEIVQNRNLANSGLYTSDSKFGPNEGHSNNLRLSAAYDINKNQYLGLSYIGNINKYTGNATSVTNVQYPDESLNSKSNATLASKTQTKYSNLTFNYNAVTDKQGSKLSIISDYTYHDRKNDNGMVSQTYDYQNLLIADTNYMMHQPSLSKIFTASASYTQNFKSGIHLSFGGKYTDTHIDNTTDYDVFENDVWHNLSNMAFQFDYKEKVWAGFIDLQGNIKKLEYKIGLRAEDYKVSGNLSGSQDTLIKKDRLDWFPTLFLKHNLDSVGKHILTFAFNRRTNRPPYYQLNPFKYYIDTYSLVQGNPYLNPEFTNSFELAYLLKQKYSLSFNYSKNNDVINEIVELNPDTKIMIDTRKNIGSFTTYRVQLGAPVTIAKWWNSYNNFGLSQQESISPQFSVKKLSLLAQTNQEIRFSKTANMTLSGAYISNYVIGNLVLKNTKWLDIGFQKKFFDNQLTAKANISDVFYSRPFNAVSYYNGNELHFHKKEQTRVLTVSLVYNFKTGKQVNEKQIEHSNADEKGRL